MHAPEWWDDDEEIDGDQGDSADEEDEADAEENDEAWKNLRYISTWIVKGTTVNISSSLCLMWMSSRDEPRNQNNFSLNKS